MLPIITLAAAVIVASAAYAAPTDLASYRWKARPLVIIAPSEDQPAFKKQMAEVEAQTQALNERDMVVLKVTRSDDPLRTTLGVRGDAFQVVLVGKDGHIAERWSSPVSLSTVFALIDRMPMRRDEMRRQGQ